MARNFDSTDDGLNHVNPTPWSNASDWLLCAWVRPASMGEGNLGGVFVPLNAGGAQVGGMTFGAINNRLYASQHRGASKWYQSRTGVNSIPYDEWSLVAAWYNWQTRVEMWVGDLNTQPAEDTDVTLSQSWSSDPSVDTIYIGELGYGSGYTWDGDLGPITMWADMGEATSADIQSRIYDHWKGRTPNPTNLFGHWPLNSGNDVDTVDIEKDYSPNGYDLSTTSDSTRPSPVVGPPLAHMRRFGGMPI